MEDPNRPVTGYPAPNGYSANRPPAGTAYPYAAAASSPQQNNYYYQTNPYYQPHYPDADSVRRATFLRRIFTIIIAMVVILVCITLIVWMVLRPQLPDFRVDSVSLSNFTIGNNSLVSFTSEIRLTAQNPNKKMTLAYDHIEAGIFYKWYSLSETTVPPFSQDRKSASPLTANFAAAGSFVEKPALDGINGERDRNGNVLFNFRMLSTVKFEAKSWRKTRFLKVYCPLVVAFPTNGRSGTLIGGPRQCRVVI